MERAGERRIKIRKKALFIPLILTFSRKGRRDFFLNLAALGYCHLNTEIRAAAPDSLLRNGNFL
jgi:hypothetical protein